MFEWFIFAQNIYYSNYTFLQNKAIQADYLKHTHDEIHIFNQYIY